MRQNLTRAVGGTWGGRIGSTLVLLAALAAGGCCTVSIPPGGATEDARYAAELSDAFQVMNAREVNAQYEAKIQESFTTLGDPDLAMYVWLQIVDCEARRSTPVLARFMYQHALDTYRVHGGNPEILLVESRSEARNAAPWLFDQWLTTLRAIN